DVEGDIEEARGEILSRRKSRRALGAASRYLHLGSRGILLGALLTVCFGVLAVIPLVVRVLFPRLAGRIRGRLSGLFRSHRRTRLRLERTALNPGPHYGQLGYTLQEMTDIAERQLRDIGLTRNFARLVL